MFGGDRIYPMLQAGTARMGKSSDDCVLDPSCQVHSVRNLYVADSSSFPSAGNAPYTLTIMVNALRIGETIVRRGK